MYILCIIPNGINGVHGRLHPNAVVTFNLGSNLKCWKPGQPPFPFKEKLPTVVSVLERDTKKQCRCDFPGYYLLFRKRDYQTTACAPPQPR